MTQSFPLTENTYTTIVLGSKNASKVSAVQKLFPNAKQFHFLDVSSEISSEVPNQPMSDAETILGCKERALQARNLFLKQQQEKCNLSETLFIGLEGGISAVDDLHHFQTTWCCVLEDDSTNESKVELPHEEQLIMESDKHITGRKNKQKLSLPSSLQRYMLHGVGSSARFALPSHVIHMMKNDTAELGNILHFSNQEEKNKGAIWKYSGGCIAREDLNLEALKMALIQLNMQKQVIEQRNQLEKELQEDNKS